MPRTNQREMKMRKCNMMSEGGPVLSANFINAITKIPTTKKRENEMRKNNMMSEGGTVLSAYLNKDTTNISTDKKERSEAKTMMDEGGIGAEVYYTNEQKIAKKAISNDGSHLH